MTRETGTRKEKVRKIKKKFPLFPGHKQICAFLNKQVKHNWNAFRFAPPVLNLLMTLAPSHYELMCFNVFSFYSTIACVTSTLRKMHTLQRARVSVWFLSVVFPPHTSPSTHMTDVLYDYRSTRGGRASQGNLFIEIEPNIFCKKHFSFAAAALR